MVGTDIGRTATGFGVAGFGVSTGALTGLVGLRGAALFFGALTAADVRGLACTLPLRMALAFERAGLRTVAFRALALTAFFAGIQNTPRAKKKEGAIIPAHLCLYSGAIGFGAAVLGGA